MNDQNVHADTHPTGHPNKTAVNAENPIFGRPADPVVAEASVEQAAVVQSAKHPRETVISPLINEEVASANAADWTKTAGEGLTADTSDAETGAEYQHGSGSGSESSKITPVEVVELPTQDQADAVVAGAAEEQDNDPTAADLDAVAGDPSVAPAAEQVNEPAAAEA